jgi:hypothetical protein
MVLEYHGTYHLVPLDRMLCHNILIDWKRAHMCTENHVCFGRIHGSQLRESHTYTLPHTTAALVRSTRMLCHIILVDDWKGTHTCAPRTVHLVPWYVHVYVPGYVHV